MKQTLLFISETSILPEQRTTQNAKNTLVAHHSCDLESTLYTSYYVSILTQQK